MGLLPNPKVTMEFSQGAVGWSESHYYNGTPSINDPTLYAAALALITARAELLDNENDDIQLVKFSIDNINRDVGYLKTGDLPILGFGGAGINTGDTFNWLWQSPHLSWPIKMLDANNNQIAITYIAGMPARNTQRSNQPYDVPSGGSPGALLQVYAQYLKTGPWGASSRTWPANTVTLATSTPITAPVVYNPATAFTGATFSVTVAAAGPTTNLAPGGYVRVGGWKYTTPQTRLRLNGTYLVVAYDGTVAKLAAPRVKAAPTFTTQGWMQAATQQFQKYQEWTLDNQTHRKRGRVANSPRGRR